MAGIIGVKIKIMPSSIETNLEKIKELTMKIVKEEGGINREYLIEPIAFGIKSLIAFFQWPEEKALDSLEEKINKIEEIQSANVIDMRKIA